MGSITDKANYLKETKRQIKTAIQDKGVEVSDTDTFRSYAAKINSIEATGGGDTLPIGSIVSYGKETAPANWLICDGSAVSRMTYADLFAVIGTKYGEGDGSTTFNLPNLKGRVPVGLDSDDTDFNTIGKIGGEKKHKLTIEELASHNHIVKVNDNAARDTAIGVTVPYSYSGENRDTSKTGGDQPHNNLQPYEVNNFIIKAFQIAGVVAEVVNTQTESDTSVYSCNYINGQIDELEAEKFDKGRIYHTYVDDSARVGYVYSCDYINNTIAYCRMSIDGTETISTEGKIITSFVNPISYGGFVADKDNGYLFIPKGTKTIETFGMICGSGYFSARLEIKDASGVHLSAYNYVSNSILAQPSGNGYSAIALPTSIIELDETKDWYIYIRISGYTQNFMINDGFGTQTAWFGAKKIR